MKAKRIHEEVEKDASTAILVGISVGLAILAVLFAKVSAKMTEHFRDPSKVKSPANPELEPSLYFMSNDGDFSKKNQPN